MMGNSTGATRGGGKSVLEETEIAEAVVGLQGRGARWGCGWRTLRGGSGRKLEIKTDNPSVVKGGAANSVVIFEGGVSRITYLGNYGPPPEGGRVYRAIRIV